MTKAEIVPSLDTLEENFATCPDCGAKQLRKPSSTWKKRLPSRYEERLNHTATQHPWGATERRLANYALAECPF